jgi:hypothetical protein
MRSVYEAVAEIIEPLIGTGTSKIRNIASSLQLRLHSVFSDGGVGPVGTGIVPECETRGVGPVVTGIVTECEIRGAHSCNYMKRVLPSGT